MDKINISKKLKLITDYWQPKIVGELNDQHVRLVKINGEFDWHQHDLEDELFLVIHGHMEMQFRHHTIRVDQGEFIIVPRGVEHCPRADQETHILLFEPATTLNTGNIRTDKTIELPEKI